MACLDRFVSPFPLHHGQGGFPWDGGLLFQGEGRGVDHALKLSSGRKPLLFAFLGQTYIDPRAIVDRHKLNLCPERAPTTPNSGRYAATRAR